MFTMLFSSSLNSLETYSAKIVGILLFTPLFKGLCTIFNFLDLQNDDFDFINLSSLSFMHESNFLFLLINMLLMNF